MARFIWVSLAFAPSFGRPANAVPPPLRTGDVTLAPPGSFEVYSGYLYTEQESRQIERQRPITALHLGLSPRQELTAEIPLSRVTTPGGVTEQGFGDAVVGINFLGIEASEGQTGAAASFEVKLDNGDAAKGLGTDAINYDVRLRLESQQGNQKRFLNGGYTFVGRPEVGGIKQERRNVWFASLAEDVSLSKVMGLLAEIVFEMPSVPGDSNQVSANTGFRWNVSKEVEIVSTFGRSLRSGDKGGPHLRAYTGVVMRFWTSSETTQP